MEDRSERLSRGPSGSPDRTGWPNAAGAADEGREAQGSPADLQERVRQLEIELRRLTSALEDVVALALTTGDSKQRSIMMHRRAVAALSGLDSRAAPQAPHR